MSGIIGVSANESAFLSTYYMGEPIVFEAANCTAISAEHLFQALKARDGRDFQKILACPMPGEAKAMGRHLLRLRLDWETVKYDAMRLVLGLKFTTDRNEGRGLVETGTALIEASTWNDRTWGKSFVKGEDAPSGRNWLGTLMMARRAELVAELDGAPAIDYGPTLEFVRYRPPTGDR